MFLYCYMETVLSTEGRPREASFGWGGMRHLRARYAIASRGGSRRQTGWAHYQDALRSETRRRQIADDAANGAPRGAVASGDGCGSSEQSGHSRITRPATPGQPGRLLGAPSPLALRGRTAKEIRANPRARQKTGAVLLWFLAIEYERTSAVSGLARMEGPNEPALPAPPQSATIRQDIAARTKSPAAPKSASRSIDHVSVRDRKSTRLNSSH